MNTKSHSTDILERIFTFVYDIKQLDLDVKWRVLLIDEASEIRKVKCFSQIPC